MFHSNKAVCVCKLALYSFNSVENPVRARKVSDSLLTTLRIVEERHLGSLTCHVLRSKETDEVYEHFIANSSTVFRE